jgi:stage II sporulation protein D
VFYQGKIAYALFCSYAGNKTASLSEAFPELIKIANSYIKVLSSPGAKYAPANERHWKVSIPKSELTSIFGAGADIDAIKIASKGPSGRALNITAGKKTVKAYTLRSDLGGERLKSTLISRISVQGDKVVFEGSGWGHGCGLSQWGAFEMAKQGKTASQIVSYYFPGTQLVKLWK